MTQAKAFESLSEWRDALAALGAKPLHARMLSRALMGRAAPLDPEDERFPKRLRTSWESVLARWNAVLRLHSRHPGSDGESERLLGLLADGEAIESVLLPRRGVCVSTQCGCAVGCRFCMTGRGGLRRQLSDVEIAAQAALARKLRPETKKVVFMGMGEPSHNWRAVESALVFLAEYGEFSRRDLVVSTVGDPRLFARLSVMDLKPALALSLHTIDDAKRRFLLPNGCRMSADEVLEAALSYAEASAYPLQIEWTLLAGVNDGADEARALAEKLRGRYAMVNYIPVNAIPEAGYARPDRERALELVKTLRSAGVVATLRDSAAQEVEGGCGQLRARVFRAAPPHPPVSGR